MWMRNPIHCFLCVPCHPASSWCKGLCYTQLKAGAFLPYQPGPLLPYFPMRIIIRMAINEIMTCSIKSQVMLKKNKEIKMHWLKIYRSRILFKWINHHINYIKSSIRKKCIFHTCSAWRTFTKDQTMQPAPRWRSRYLVATQKVWTFPAFLMNFTKGSYYPDFKYLLFLNVMC